ncbi:MBTPS2 [Branchiostoma lanceolatum]|uniref:Membrane-bound transcription factor site-2 protease n=1 Tax=Branchiostoma lanceolatum TaxID=7740 RepID=A0A8J9YJF2_BRALA|nr:MBTPS2 [Branchiostoma lanceolatum]
MIQLSAVALLFLFWGAVYAADILILSSSYSRRYERFLHHTGVSVSLGQVRWYTAGLNRTFVRLASWQSHWQRAWFSAGVWFAYIAMVGSIVLLVGTLVQGVRNLTRAPEERTQQILVPVMPGVNLPWNHMVYFAATLLLAGVLHELGHAIAAIREQVRVNGFGIFCFVIYPGAFVDLSTEHLDSVSAKQKLRIFCAGVWHNFVLVLLALVLLMCMPFLLLPLYSTGQAAVVTGLVEGTAVSGPRGLLLGDHVTRMDDCPIRSKEDWEQCILGILHTPHRGFCQSADQIEHFNTAVKVHKTAHGVVECCNTNTSLSELCFSYHHSNLSSQNHACLPARRTASGAVCRTNSDCLTPGHHKLSQPWPHGVYCLFPALDNNTRLVRVSQGRDPPMLFLGNPWELYYHAKVSSYMPRFNFLPLELPEVLETFCKYLISLSGALAVLNVVPCHALDGQWILSALVDLQLGKLLPNRRDRDAVAALVSLLGTVLLGANIALALWSLVFR